LIDGMACSKCGGSEELAPRRKHCKTCEREYQRIYRQKNAERLKKHNAEYLKARRESPEFIRSERKRGREYWQALRREVMGAYGGSVCACCGETEEQFLTIDHVFNDGAKHRRQIGYKDGNGKGSSSATLRWLKTHNYPSGFQVLCMNCNLGKQRNGGICPHKSQSNENGVNSGKVQTG